MNKQKATYEPPKMEVFPLLSRTDLLCSSGDSNCIILNYNENPVNLDSSHKGELT